MESASPASSFGFSPGRAESLRVVQQHDAGGKSRPAWPPDSAVSAVFSDCQQYRYQLREIWNPGAPLVLWLLMNPSVACVDYSDPTLRKTGTFARAWGYGGQLVGNVHAYRATDKRRLLELNDPVGPKNDRMILEMAASENRRAGLRATTEGVARSRSRSCRPASAAPWALPSSIGQGWHPGPSALSTIHLAPEISPGRLLTCILRLV